MDEHIDAVRVLVVDDQPRFRAVARNVVGSTPGFVVAGEAADGADAIAQLHELRPALVLMDINMPGLDGIEATRRIGEAAPEVAVVLLSSYDAADLPAAARSCGAVAYLNKEALSPEALRDVWAGAARARRTSAGG